ncbi:MAG TPA: hypothetical protein ENG59_03265 [Chloroflexi bacterium]|nr:MAG: hypothetical protein DRI46_02095 [Chloroflexota bacterium]HDD55243.1 hypothetical protein [Chloroflexota bacterium]
MMELLDREIFRELYRGFAMPLSEIDCGLRCGPYNEYGVPVCCDIHLVIPSAFDLEWGFLKENTDLWQPWSCHGSVAQGLEEELQDGQVLLQCKGYQECQRDYRTLTCRAFPFYPYLDSKGFFPGLGYYPDFRDVCWIISNLEVVSQVYKEAFQRTFQRVFEFYPEYRSNFASYSNYLRAEASEKNEKIVLLGFSGNAYLVNPQTEQNYEVDYKELGAYGPFEISRELQFPAENRSLQDTEK